MISKCMFCKRRVWFFQRQGWYISRGYYQTDPVIVRWHRKCWVD